MTIPWTQLIRELHDMDCFNLPQPRDECFYCPSPDWLSEYGYWTKREERSYQTEKFDCDDFSLLAVTEVTDALVKTKTINDCGHTFMYCNLAIATELNGVGAGNHATNIIRCSDDRWYFFERQNGRTTQYEIPINSRDINPPYFILL